jgi:hypothetical protein
MSASSQTPSTTTPLLSSAVYDKLKHTVAIALPALAALYIGLGQVWHFPNIEQVSGSIATVNTFLGVLLGLSTKSYNNSDAKYAGVIQVDDSGATKKISLVVNGDPEDVLTSASGDVTFKVSDTGETPIVNPNAPQH